MNNISLIYAASPSGVIGNKNTLPWRIPEDLKMFARVTGNCNVIMGRNTWESMNCKPLKNRTNFVVTSNPNYVADGAIVITDAVEFVKNYADKTPLFVIGGATLYNQLQQYCDTAYVTRVFTEVEGDTIFKLDDTEWIIHGESEVMESNGHQYQFFHYVKEDVSDVVEDTPRPGTFVDYITGGV